MSAVRYIALLCAALAACSFDRDEHPQACSDDAACKDGASCHAGFCVRAAQAGDLCAEGSPIERCYAGPEGTQDVGACVAGQRFCVGSAYSECFGQALPSREICNAKDDDCDGRVDDLPPAAACDSRLQGACSEGALMCREGVELCAPTQEAQSETCNAIDDDCDGSVDEVSATVCFPSGMDGCVLDTAGVWQCSGLCATGLIACDDGNETCNGALTAGQELCVSDEPFAQDEDCDGMIDEDCDCMVGEPRSCYAGPPDTLGHGRCTAGTQRCEGTQWTDCAGQVLPRAESCDNPTSDDDCNDVEDDVAGLGMPCIAGDEMGACRNGALACSNAAEPECVAGEPGEEECDDVDQDCDGDPTNGFDFTSDQHCGACGERCRADVETCCGGTCVARASFEDDVDNCGACGRTCGEGQYCCQGDCLSVGTPMMQACDCKDACDERACCGRDCRDLQRDKDNCGACGVKCSMMKSCVDGTCR
jgi:hypothetical protein